MHSQEMEEVDIATAGDVIAVFGIECASMDTFTDGEVSISLASMFVPKPVMSLAVRPKDMQLLNGFSKVSLPANTLRYLLCLCVLHLDMSALAELGHVASWASLQLVALASDIITPIALLSNPLCNCSPFLPPQAIQKFTREDPTLRVMTDSKTGETIMSGMGELHLEIYIERMKREYQVECISGKRARPSVL